MVDFLLPWLATLVWIAAVPPLVLGWWAGEEEEEQARGVGSGGGGAGLSLRVGVTGLTAAARLAVGRFQIQAYLEGAKESALKDLRQRKVCLLFLICHRTFGGRFWKGLCGRSCGGGCRFVCVCVCSPR